MTASLNYRCLTALRTGQDREAPRLRIPSLQRAAEVWYSRALARPLKERGRLKEQGRSLNKD